jgi:hypothetical protein
LGPTWGQHRDFFELLDEMLTCAGRFSKTYSVSFLWIPKSIRHRTEYSFFYENVELLTALVVPPLFSVVGDRRFWTLEDSCEFLLQWEGRHKLLHRTLFRVPYRDLGQKTTSNQHPRPSRNCRRCSIRRSSSRSLARFQYSPILIF